MSGCAECFAYRQSVSCEDGCTRLNENFNHKIEGIREGLQWIQVLVPLRYLSLNPNICGLRSHLRVGYSDEELPLKKTIFLDDWNINSLED